MDGLIVGREEELETIARLVTGGDRIRALMLEVEAGIGKSSLWAHGVALARAGSLTVLSARPAEAEAAMPYVAAVDLVEPLLGAAPPPFDDVLAGRPAHERLAASATSSLERAHHLAR
jgi:hypothetical protein